MAEFPHLLIILGTPASGKTTLARAQIAARLSCIVEGNWRPAHARDLLRAAAAPPGTPGWPAVE